MQDEAELNNGMRNLMSAMLAMTRGEELECDEGFLPNDGDILDEMD